MATRILGLDIGSRFVRGVVLESQGRSIRLAQLIEEPIERVTVSQERPSDAHDDISAAAQEETLERHADPAASTPDPLADPSETALPKEVAILDPIDERAWDDATRATVQRILQRPDFDIDWLITSAPEGAFMYTQIELPFHTDREVRSVLGPQLDDRLPGDDEDLHLDYMVVGKSPEQDDQYRIYAGGIAQREMAQIIAQWQSISADPRIIDIMPFPLFTAGEWLAPSTDRTVAYIDIGAHYTRIVISHDGNIDMARTIPGGGEAIIGAIADEFDISLDEARIYKPEESITPEDEEDDQDVDKHPRLTAALNKGLRATLRDLRRTLAAHAAGSEHSVSHIYLGGTALDLAALPAFIQRFLGMPVDVLRFNREEVNTIPNARGVSHRFTTALGLALRAHPPESRSRFNLRNGTWAFRGAYAYISQRLPALALLAGALLFGLAFFLIARNALFKAEYRAADDGLALISKQVFGVEVREPDLVKNRLARGVDGLGLHPDISAFDVVVRISQAAQKTVDDRMPIEMDNIDVDMGRRQVRISGVCDSANAAETFGRKLGEDNCLQSIQRNNLSQRRSDSKFEFSYTASVSCRTPDPAASQDERPEEEDDESADEHAVDEENEDTP